MGPCFAGVASVISCAQLDLEFFSCFQPHQGEVEPFLLSALIFQIPILRYAHHEACAEIHKSVQKMKSVGFAIRHVNALETSVGSLFC